MHSWVHNVKACSQKNYGTAGELKGTVVGLWGGMYPKSTQGSTNLNTKGLVEPQQSIALEKLFLQDE